MAVLAAWVPSFLASARPAETQPKVIKHAKPGDVAVEVWEDSPNLSATPSDALSSGLAPLTKPQVIRMLEIAERGQRLDDQVFAKIGDSMTVSRAYLAMLCWDRGGLG